MGTTFDTARLVAMMLTSAACRPDLSQRCIADREAQDWTAALTSCGGAADATLDPRRAIDAAMAAYQLQRPQDVLRYARRGLDGTPSAAMAAVAHFYLGYAAVELDDYAAAARELETSAQLNGSIGNVREEARADQLLAGAWRQLGEHVKALETAMAAHALVEPLHDARMLAYIDLARAVTLREMGLGRESEAMLEQVLAEADDDDERIIALLERGILHIEQHHPALARAPLALAIDIERRARQPRVRDRQALHLNLALVERKAGEFQRALDEVDEAKRAGVDAMSYHLERGMVYADMGRLPEARDDLDRAEAEHPLGDWTWWIPLQRAQVAARMGDVGAAIAADRRAIAAVAKVASAAGAFGATMIANHREPHLHLIGLFAAQRRWRDVLDVVAVLDGQALLGSREAASERSASDPGALARAAHVTPPVPQDAVAHALEAWRGRRLVIVVPGGDRVWRLDVQGGEITGSDVGAATALAELARKLETEPGDAAAGRALGQAFLPPLAPGEVVALLVVGPPARAPLAGLLIGDRPAFARNPLVRARGLLSRATPGARGARSIVVGDPRGDLPAAAEEARKVAARLAVPALVGPAATRAAVLSAAGADVLHVAAHTEQRHDGATLELSDGPIALADIARLAPAPRLVVLASCGAAAGRDDAGNGSLATAFLDAGADAVVGTRWSVGDADAAQVIATFYAADGARDPARALARVALDPKLAITTRAAFELFVARPD